MALLPHIRAGGAAAVAVADEAGEAAFPAAPEEGGLLVHETSSPPVTSTSPAVGRSRPRGFIRLFIPSSPEVQEILMGQLITGSGGSFS